MASPPAGPLPDFPPRPTTVDDLVRILQQLPRKARLWITDSIGIDQASLPHPPLVVLTQRSVHEARHVRPAGGAITVTFICNKP